MYRIFLALPIVFLSFPAAANQATVQHDLDVVLEPQREKILINDQITLPLTPQGTVRFSLYPGTVITESDIPVKSESATGDRFHQYSMIWPEDRKNWHVKLELPWAGTSKDYLWLDGTASWYPQLEGPISRSFPLLRHSLKITLPATWHAVSQGEAKRVPHERSEAVDWLFVSQDPQQSIELVAAPFNVYSNTDAVPAYAYLLHPDKELAEKYLQATSRYIVLYEKMLGAYPYRSFSLVENPEQTGYGMPSFTLLGSRVIRLPFILDTSYPHEILHNWWGNSVYIDPDGGNWSEGLTAYLADHYLKEIRGEGSAYRRDALQAYRNYVSAKKDFALRKFLGRHDRASQAVGYNKTMMFFHMLRLQLGEQKFFDALKKLYREKKFHLVAFHDLRPFFKSPDFNLQIFFSQWIDRVGAPELRLGPVIRAPDNTLRLVLRQIQSGPAYQLSVPIVLRDADAKTVRAKRLNMQQREQIFEIDVPENAHTLHIDPEYDVFRLLDFSEIPPSIGAVLGNDQWTFVLPRAASPDEQKAMQVFVQQMGPSSKVLWDDQLLPSGVPLWLLGRRNRLSDQFAESLSAQELRLSEQTVEIAGRTFDLKKNTVVIAGRIGTTPWLWTAGDSELDGLARRLRHYGKYSYLAIERGRPVLRGQWAVHNSVLQEQLP